MEEEDKGHFHNCTHSKYHNLSKWSTVSREKKGEQFSTLSTT